MTGESKILRPICASELPTIRRDLLDAHTLSIAQSIVNDVRTNGIRALRHHAEKFGDLTSDQPITYDAASLAQARDRLDRATRDVLERTAARITCFAAAQRAAFSPMQCDVSGARAGHELAPVHRAGCYVPGGRYPLVSTALMTALTARAAGVREVWIASPRPNAVMLGAAAIAGADVVLAAGGAQAIAALAFGAGEQIPPCDVIVGPGNRYVTAAKHIVSEVVRIDMPAGPSELLIVADYSADPALVAADLLAQAEHDVDARANLVAFSERTVQAVEVELHRQLANLPTRETAIESLNKSFAVVVDSSDAACDVCNQIAPEHLHLNVAQPDDFRPKIKNYGAIFIGAATPEVLGDYGIGPNHVLPTGGAARAFGGLSVLNFLRVRTWIDATGALGDEVLATDVAHFARLEGLEAHAHSMDKRAG